jgi:hypothetical protein
MTIYNYIYIIHILNLNHDNDFVVSVNIRKSYKYWVLNLHSELIAHEIIRAIKIVGREAVTNNWFII